MKTLKFGRVDHNQNHVFNHSKGPTLSSLKIFFIKNFL